MSISIAGWPPRGPSLCPVASSGSGRRAGLPTCYIFCPLFPVLGPKTKPAPVRMRQQQQPTTPRGATPRTRSFRPGPVLPNYHIIAQRSSYSTITYTRTRLLDVRKLQTRRCWYSMKVSLHQLLHYASNANFNLVNSSPRPAC